MHHLGDVLAGRWNVYIRAGREYISSDVSIPGRTWVSVRSSSPKRGWKFIDNPRGSTCIRPFPRSAGRIITAKLLNGEGRIRSDTHLAPYRRRTAEFGDSTCRVLDHDQRDPEKREKLLISGAYYRWRTIDEAPINQTLASW